MKIDISNQSVRLNSFFVIFFGDLGRLADALRPKIPRVVAGAKRKIAFWVVLRAWKAH